VNHQIEALRPDTAAAYLRSRGLLIGQIPDGVRAVELTGGVSGTVITVEAGGHRWVVKQALPELKVAATWQADPARAETEAAAMRLFNDITPLHTPVLLDSDPDRHILTMSCAPASWVPWKEQLLAEHLDACATRATAGALGGLLGRWHSQSAPSGHLHSQANRNPFMDLDPFEQLRVTPFYRKVAAVHPQVATAVDTCIHELLNQRECLVHGDFSPKNVLVGASGWWMLDFEVAHLGAPVFDVAFLLSHLLLKAAARPQHARTLRLAAEDFQGQYRTARHRRLCWPTLAAHVACLLLARIDGVSPVSYLAEDAREKVRDVALAALTTPSRGLEFLWSEMGAPQ